MAYLNSIKLAFEKLQRYMESKMSFGAEKRSAFQLIDEHIKSLQQDVNKIDAQQHHLEKLRNCAVDDIYQKYDSLVREIKESHAETEKQLNALYQAQKRKLDEAQEKLIERKTKAETELIVDHKPVEIPEVSLNFTVNIVSASQAIGLLKLSAESGKNTFSPFTKLELKAEYSSGSVGGFSFPSTSSDSGKTPMFASLSAPSVPPRSRSNKATCKQKKRQTAAASTLTPKMETRNLRDFIRCRDCRKPRCVYSKRMLNTDDKECWNRLKDILPYRCGVNLFPTQPLTVELTDCSKEVNFQYFNRERRFPTVCYKCGVDISSSKQMHEEKESDLIVHDVCQTCKVKGMKPRIKKRPPSKKAKM